MSTKVEVWAYKYIEKGNRKVLLHQITECAKLFCRVGETARILGCSAQYFSKRLTIDTEIFDAWEDGLANASMVLRQTQLELAKKAPGMAIFLGKNYLGQEDEPKVKQRDDNELKRQLGNLSPDRLLQIQKILTEAKDEDALKKAIPANVVVDGG